MPDQWPPSAQTLDSSGAVSGEPSGAAPSSSLPARGLADQIGLLLEQSGADLWGVADLTGLSSLPGGGPRVSLEHYPRAIAVAVAFPPAIVRELLAGPSHTYLYYYNILNTRLDDIALRLCSLLASRSKTAYPVPASQRVGGDRLQSVFSHRMAARLAGLGWIGRSACLITPLAGPRVRLVTVLTDADLAPAAPIPDGCGACRACVDACPAGAMTGTAFRPDQPLSDRLNPSLCTAYKDKIRDRWGKRCCGLCLASCPVGQ